MSNISFPKIVLWTFTLIGIFTKSILGLAVSSKDGSLGPASTSIWGNLIIIFSLISYLCIDINKVILYPLSLLIMILMWDTTISYKYFEQINKNEIPKIYYSWTFFSNLMILSFIILMIYMLYYKDKNEKQVIALLYIIGVFCLFIAGIQQTILDNFMVDKDYLDINL